MPRKKVGEYNRRKQCKVMMNGWEREMVHQLREHLGDDHFSPVVRKAIEFFYEARKPYIDKGVKLGYVRA